MNLLALRNLFHDKVRLVVTLTGIVFALVLMAVQSGIFLGFTTTISAVVDHSSADLWVATRGLQNWDMPQVFSERKLYQVKAVPGVRDAEKVIVAGVNWKKPGGGLEGVEVVGFDPESSMIGPWNLVAGRLGDLKLADGVVIDELFQEKLGITHLGQTVEINGFRARVVGFTRGIRSFTTNPFVFTTFKNALNYSAMRADQTMYVVARLEPGAFPQDVKRRLRERVSNIDVFTTPELSRKTQLYWMLTTGAGMTLVIAAFLGLLVGIAIVAQTIYATTMDHLREFGTLKAMGASNAYIYGVILCQAVYSATLGYGIGMAISLACAYLSRKAFVGIILNWQLAVGLFFVTVLMCMGSAVVSINTVMRVDPAMVFKA